MSTTAGPGARTRATSWDEVETANGGAGNDTLLAYDDGGFSLLGGAGDDVLSGSQGDDRVERVGDDRLEAGDVVGAILMGGSATTSGGRPLLEGAPAATSSTSRPTTCPTRPVRQSRAGRRDEDVAVVDRTDMADPDCETVTTRDRPRRWRRAARS